MSSSLPSLRDVCELNPSGKPALAADALCSFVPMEAVDERDAQITRSITRRFGEVSKGYTPFIDNDVIIAKITPCAENGKCAIGRRLTNGVGFGSTEFHVLRAGSEVLPEWLLYFWRYTPTRQRAAA